MGRRLHERMIQGAFEGTQPDVQQACAEVLARKDVQMELGTVLSPIAERVLILVDAAAEGDVGNADGEEMARFWERWKESFAREFGLFEYLPWETVDEEDLRSLLGEMVQRLTGTPGEWNAFFRIRGIDLADSPEGPVLRVGSVTLHDPDIYDFGEGRFKLWDDGVDGPYVVARAMVEEDGPAVAERVGLRGLADALNVLTFAYADPRRRIGGLKGEVLPGALLAKSDGSLSQYRPRLGGARTSAVLRTKDRNIGVYAGAYRGLLEETRDEGRPSEGAQGRIRPGFLKGVHWYARGLWEPDPLQRFLAHWIGLEHLFVSGGESKKAIVDEVPKLTVTWRTLRGMLFTGMTLQDLVRQAKVVAGLKTEADRHPELAGWDEDARVLLDPAKVKVFALLAAGRDATLAQRLEDFVDELRELAYDNEAIDQDVEAMREQESFKLLGLNNVRNKVVHEAVRDVPGIEAYADKTEKLLGDVLEKLVGDAVEADPENEFVKDLMVRHAQQPWLEGRRGMPVTEEVLERLLSVGKDSSDGSCFKYDSADLLDEARAKRTEAL